MENLQYPLSSVVHFCQSCDARGPLIYTGTAVFGGKPLRETDRRAAPVPDVLERESVGTDNGAMTENGAETDVPLYVVVAVVLPVFAPAGTVSLSVHAPASSRIHDSLIPANETAAIALSPPGTSNPLTVSVTDVPGGP